MLAAADDGPVMQATGKGEPGPEGRQRAAAGASRQQGAGLECPAQVLLPQLPGTRQAGVHPQLSAGPGQQP